MQVEASSQSLVPNVSETKTDYTGLQTMGIAYLIDCAVAFTFFALTPLLLFKALREWPGIGEQWLR